MTISPVGSLHYVGAFGDHIDFTPVENPNDPDTFITLEEKDPENVIPAKWFFWDTSVFTWAEIGGPPLFLASTIQEHVSDNTTNSTEWTPFNGSQENPWELSITLPPGVTEAVYLATFVATVSNAADGGIIDFRMMVDANIENSVREEVFRSVTRVSTPWSDKPALVVIKKRISIASSAIVSLDWRTSGEGSVAQCLSETREWENASLVLELTRT